MKKIILIISVLFFSINVKSQITKDYWMLGGDAIVRGYKFDNSQKFTYNAEIFPKIGYFISNKFVIGSELGFFINKATFYTSLIPFGRYYFSPPEKNINPFIEAGVGYKKIFFKDTSNTFDEPIYQIKIGFSIFFTNSTALNLTLNYKKNAYYSNQEISLAFGFQIHLQKK